LEQLAGESLQKVVGDRRGWQGGGVRVWRLQDGDYSSKLLQGVSWASNTFFTLTDQFKFDLIQNSTKERRHKASKELIYLA